MTLVSIAIPLQYTVPAIHSSASPRSQTNRTENQQHPLQLELQQVANHLACGNACGGPQSREVECAGEGIGVAEEQHRGDPAAGVLEREARAVHLVLLDLAADQVVHGTGGVALGLEGSGNVGELLAVQDVEVVVRGVAAGVALGADGGT